MPLTLIDTQDRAKLGEGRQRGLGTAFARRDGDQLTMVDPISPCREYCNDRLASELTGKPFAAYGLSCSPIGLLGKDHIYMVMAMCKQGPRSLIEYEGYHDDLKALATNYPNMEAFMRQVEERLGVKGRTTITQVGDNRFAIELPSYWGQYTYLISLYILLLRSALRYKEGEALDYLGKLESEDRYAFTTVLPKLKRMFEGFLPKQDIANLSYAHGIGIVNFPFPAPAVPATT